MKRKSILFQKNKAQKLLKRRRKYNRWKKEQNFRKNSRSSPKPLRLTKNPYTSKVENISINAGTSFTLFDNPENCISIIRKLDSVKKINHNGFINVKIDLSSVTWIDRGAISFLLAKINEIQLLKGRKIKIWGNSPEHEKALNVFNESGFLEYMRDKFGKNFNSSSRNHISKVGSDRTLNRKIGKTIEKSMKYLTGTEEKYGPLYSVINEMCLNSVEWANDPDSRNKNWFLGVNKLERNGVKYLNFTLSDVGYGIIKTLYRNFAKHITDTLADKPNVILERAFERKYGSKSREKNRNRGLPLIKKTSDKGFINNLVVITNNVNLDFDNKENSKKIDVSLPGTFYNWDVDLKCIELWKQQKQ